MNEAPVHTDDFPAVLLKPKPAGLLQLWCPCTLGCEAECFSHSRRPFYGSNIRTLFMCLAEKKILDVRQLPPTKPCQIRGHSSHWSLHPRHIERTQIMAILGDLENYIKPLAKKFGVILDQNLCLEPQVKRVAQSCFYHLRKTAKLSLLFQPHIWRSLSMLLLKPPSLQQFPV